MPDLSEAAIEALLYVWDYEPHFVFCPVWLDGKLHYGIIGHDLSLEVVN